MSRKKKRNGKMVEKKSMKKAILFIWLSLAVISIGCAKPPPPNPNSSAPYILHVTGKDSRGHWNVKIDFPDQPAPINKDQSYTKKLTVELPEECWLYKVDSFNGLDRGDIVEMDTFVYDKAGRVLYQRSLHKESENMYNSFWPLATDAVTDRVDIHMHAHVTTGEPARTHWNIMLWCAPSGLASEADPADYYRLSVGEKIINDVRVDSRSDIYVGIWTSYRNLRDAANICPDLIEPTFAISPDELHTIANEGLYLLNRFENRWRERLSTENHRAKDYPEFEGRSEVRKEYWHPFEDRLRIQKAQVDKFTGIAQQDPIRETCAYDNLAGWCQCRNKFK